MNEKLLYPRESYKLRGMIYSVRNKLKLGWSEETYHQALLQLAHHNRIPIVSKQRVSMTHRGITLHTFEPDLIAWDKIILELKALPYSEDFVHEHYAQLIHYLKFFQKRLGFLVNFASSEINIKRVIWEEPPLRISRNLSNIPQATLLSLQPLIDTIFETILALAHQYGLGYPETIYRKLLAIEIRHQSLSCVEEQTILAKWETTELAVTTTPHILVAGQMLIYVRALIEHPTNYDFARTTTYLSALGLSTGLIINFGRRQLQVIGVSTDKQK